MSPVKETILMPRRQQLPLIPAVLTTFFLLLSHCVLAGHPAMPAPQKVEKQDKVWLWTMGPELDKWWAKTNNIPEDAVCTAEQLITFYGARRVMYFETGPITPE